MRLVSLTAARTRSRGSLKHLRENWKTEKPMQFPQRTLDPFSIIADNSCNQQTPHGHIRNLNPKPWPLLISLSLSKIEVMCRNLITWSLHRKQTWSRHAWILVKITQSIHVQIAQSNPYCKDTNKESYPKPWDTIPSHFTQDTQTYLQAS
jgi:hypothetical protein